MLIKIIAPLQLIEQPRKNSIDDEWIVLFKHIPVALLKRMEITHQLPPDVLLRRNLVAQEECDLIQRRTERDKTTEHIHELFSQRSGSCFRITGKLATVRQVNQPVHRVVGDLASQRMPGQDHFFVWLSSITSFFHQKPKCLHSTFQYLLSDRIEPAFFI